MLETHALGDLFQISTSNALTIDPSNRNFGFVGQSSWDMACCVRRTWDMGLLVLAPMKYYNSYSHLITLLTYAVVQWSWQKNIRQLLAACGLQNLEGYNLHSMCCDLTCTLRREAPCWMFQHQRHEMHTATEFMGLESRACHPATITSSRSSPANAHCWLQISALRRDEQLRIVGWYSYGAWSFLATANLECANKRSSAGSSKFQKQQWSYAWAKLCTGCQTQLDTLPRILGVVWNTTVCISWSVSTLRSMSAGSIKSVTHCHAQSRE